MVIVGGPREFELIPVADLPFDYLDAEGEVMTVFVSEILNIRIDYVGLGGIFYLVNHTSGWQAVDITGPNGYELEGTNRGEAQRKFNLHHNPFNTL